VRHVATLGVPPPDDPRDRVQSGLFLRALLSRSLLLSLLLWAPLALLTELPTWLLVLGATSLIALAADVLWFTYRVRRDKHRDG
jgi:hypothetical protein